MTYLRITLVVIAGLFGLFGAFAFAVAFMFMAYVILDWQYEELQQKLADTTEFVERYLKGDG